MQETLLESDRAGLLQPGVEIKVELYTLSDCSFCSRAKALLDQKGISYLEHNLSDDLDRRRWVAQKSGRKVLPQVFVNDRHLGGFFELNRLNQQGTLELKLSRR